MSFAAEIDQVAADVEREGLGLLDAVADACLESIRDGSSLTGAPGQPVAQGGAPNAGKLYASWRKTAPSETIRAVSSDVDYAAEVEDNPHGLHFATGGAHSVALTLAGFSTIVEYETRRIRGGGR